jgi:hypothetical protein
MAGMTASDLDIQGGERVDVRPNWSEQPSRPTKLRFD